MSPTFAWLREDAVTAARQLRRSPTVSAFVVVTLALGIGANVAVFSVLNRVYLREPPGVAVPTEIVRVYARRPDLLRPGGGSTVPVIAPFDYPTATAIREAVHHRAAVTTYTLPDSQVIGPPATELAVRVSYVASDYFSTLGVHPARGTFFSAAESRIDNDAGVVVLSASLWRRAFGSDPRILGTKIELNHRPRTVIGIAEEGFAGIELDEADAFLPLGALPAPRDRGRPWYESTLGSYLRVVARADDTGRRLLTRDGAVAYRRLNSDDGGQLPSGSRPDTSSELLIGPLNEALGPATKPGEINVATRAAGVAGVILLVTLANVANLLLMEATRRRRESAIRQALGAPRLRLISQAAIRALLLAGIAGAASVIGGSWGGRILWHALLPNLHWTGVAIDGRGLWVTLLLCIVSAGVSATPLILQSLRADPARFLKASLGTSDRRRRVVRSALVVTQCAASLTLLVGAAAFGRSIAHLDALAMGYDANQLAFASVAFAGAGRHEQERRVVLPQAAQRIGESQLVTGVALAQFAPMRGGSATTLFLPGSDTAVSGPQSNSVSSTFFKVVGMRIVAGRSLTVDDRRDAGGAVVVNETMAGQLWPRESALGQCVIIGRRTDPCSFVVGVAADAHQMRVVESSARPQYFRPIRAAVDSESIAAGAIIVRTAPGRWRIADPVVRAELRGLVPAAAVIRFVPMTQSFERELRPWRLGAELFAAFGALALVIAGIGTYAVVSCATAERMQELGVRVALGAGASRTYRLVLAEGIRLLGVGVAIGLILTVAGSRVISGLLYQTSVTDPTVLGFAVLTLSLACVIACLVPARRASTADPMRILRSE